MMNEALRYCCIGHDDGYHSRTISRH